MRILWLSHLIPYPPKGGVLQRAYYMLKEISKYHEVDLVAFNQKDLIAPLFSTLKTGIDEAKIELGAFCHDIHFLDIPSDQTKFDRYLLALKSVFTQAPYTINWLRSDEYRSAIKRLLAANKYDLVHFDTISLLPYFELVCDIPTVLDHHNIESHMLTRRAKNEKNALKKWYYKQEGLRLHNYEKEYCPKFTLNITCSEIDAERLRDISPDCQASEIANGVDIDYFKADEDIEQGSSIIFVGTLSWYPNIEAVRFMAYELWPALKGAVPQISADIIGANPPEDIIKFSNENADFRVHGFVDDVRPYFNRAAVYVCPINDGGGTKLKILDALSMKKAIVAHPIAFEGIHVTDGKNAKFAEDVNDYVDIIKDLLNDEALRKSIGDEARSLIEEEYSYNNIGKQLSDLYIKHAL
jgi:glycosyltransferase involved in cell wall biosynthesis